MVMDVGQETPKLIGSSLISLTRLVNQIKSDVEEHGIGTPSAYGERGTHDLCNLMGMKIGRISVACKLVSLGGSLIPHISENKIHSVGTTLSQETNGTEMANMATNVVCCKTTEGTGVKPIEKEGFCHVVCQRVKFDGHPKDIVVSEAEEKRVASTSTQTEQTKKRIKKIEIARIDYEEELSPTLFCPPPMFYSSADKCQEDKEFKTSNTGMDSLRVADLDTDEELSDSEMPPSKEQRGPAIVEHPTGSEIPPQSLAPSHLGDAIRQLPLLNALLVELSLLNGQNQQQQQPLSVHPNLAWIYTSAQGPTDPTADGTKPPLQMLKNDASPQQKAQMLSSLRRGHSERCVKSLISVSPSSKQKRVKANKHSPHPEKTKPKRKLTYGLTHTYRLRLQRLSTDLPKPRECVEHANSKQSKPAKQKNKNLSSSSSMLKKSLNLDDNIDTLINGIIVDGTQENTPPKSSDRPNICRLSIESGDLPDRKAASILKHTLKKKPVHFKQDKELHIRIPSALSQHSGRSDLEHRANKPGFSSSSEDEGGQGESRWSGPPSKCSDSDCSEGQVDYQDDFTSLDPTDGYSPDLLSSPEPRMTRVPSDPSSLNDESVRNPDLPVPVKAATSPKRSLKGTHVIRQSMRASGLSVSSDADDLRSGYTPSAHSRHSQVPQARSESQDSEMGGRASVSRHPTRPWSERSDHTDDVTHYRGYSEDSFAHHSDSDPESLSLLDPIEAEEENDQLGTLGLTQKYQHISDLIVNKLPGYTL
ncbi:microtubule-associated protein 10 [Alosa sapidissima]|uniref:microtubule-associated protein 10 n=1 Tax=Alosa sapidissima TaxID=34773 RepID=UPI001C085B21|nr:microtubule-associated protein 10 [Alosa sapidissima]